MCQTLTDFACPAASCCVYQTACPRMFRPLPGDVWNEVIEQTWPNKEIVMRDKRRIESEGGVMGSASSCDAPLFTLQATAETQEGDGCNKLFT